MVTINKNDVRVTELTQPGGDWSARFGTMLKIDDVLFMFIGPLPTIYRVGQIQPNGKKRVSRRQTRLLAQEAQQIVDDIYRMPIGIRPRTFEEVVVWVKGALGFN